MRQPLLVLFSIAISTSAFAQKDPIKFGDISIEQVKMSSYPADSSAEAVVLADYGESTITYNQNSGFELTFERTRRIKILTEAGKRWADFTIQLHKNGDLSEKVSGVKGLTVNLENGKAVESKLDKDAIFREKYSKNIDLVKITLPNVRVGSVLDITYRITSDFFWLIEDWAFQTTIPVVMSEYRALIPEYFTYEKYAQGYLAMSVADRSQKARTITIMSREDEFSKPQAQTINYTENAFRWVVLNAPAFRDEPFMTSRNDFISRINFDLAVIQMPGQGPKNFSGTWEKVNNSFAESSDLLGEVTANGHLKKLAEELTASATTTAQKVEMLHTYVRQTIAWDGEDRLYTSKTMRQVLDDKKGSSAEINLLLASMIEKLGITVKPVAISTRDHGFIRDSSPAMSQFNYTICLARWENTQVLLDATEAWLPTGLLPARCLNGKGLAISKEGYEWVNLEAPKTRVTTNTELQLSEDGTLTGILKIEQGGYEGHDKRKKYNSVGPEAYAKELVGTKSWQLTNSEYTNAKEAKESFKEKHDIAINEHVTIAGDVMYLSPFISGQWTSNPFKSEKREYPVDFGNGFDEVYVIKIKLPAGYAVDEMPATKAMALPGNAARYTMSTALSGDQLTVTSMLSVNRPLFSGTEYQNLREFCNQVVAKQTEQIVIKKKQ